MKILLLAPNSFSSQKKFPKRIFAPRSFILNLYRGLTKKGHQVCLASAPDIKKDRFDVAGDKTLLYNDSIKVDRFLNRPSLTNRDQYFSLFLRRQFYELDLVEKAIIFARKEKFDLIHTDHSVVHFFEHSSPVPIVYTMHDRLPRLNTMEYWLLGKYKDHKFISISLAQQQGSAKVNFVGNVYHGLDLKEYPFKSLCLGEYLAFIGRLVPEKGAHNAVKVAHALKLKLYVATEVVYKESRYFKKEIAPFIKKKAVTSIGFLEKGKVSFYQNARLLLFPIQWEEPFGLVMIEAMACGTPVVAYAKGSVPEVIIDGVTGFIVNSSESDKRGDWTVKKTGIEGLCEAVEKIYSMPEEEYKKMRLACRKRVEEKFTVEKMVDGYEKVYRRVLGIRK